MNRQERYRLRRKFIRAGVPIPAYLAPHPHPWRPLTSTHPRAAYHRAWRAKKRATTPKQPTKETA